MKRFLLTIWLSTLLLAVCAQVAQAGTLTQIANIGWQGDHWRRNSIISFAIPSVGTGQIVCRPDQTWIIMYPANPAAENDMWSVLFQVKGGRVQTAVKDARVYEFSTPTSTVPHGTGPSAREGFNERWPIETSDEGHAIGLISSRGALNGPAGQGTTPTSFNLSWSWSGFHTSEARCQIHAIFHTEIAGDSRAFKIVPGRRIQKIRVPETLSSSLDLNWHGEAEAPQAAARPHTLEVPGVGTLSAECLTIESGGSHLLSLQPLVSLAPEALVTTYQGEGWDNSQTVSYYTDPLTGLLGPIYLPVNGFTTVSLRVPGGPTSHLLFTSFVKLNDPNSAANYCEIAGQDLTP